MKRSRYKKAPGRSDVFSRAKRSDVMARIKGRGNRETELALMAIFRANGIKGWRRHLPITGRPDFVFPRVRLAVFVDGCFWHGCPTHANEPVNNRAFWRAKLAANRARDLFVSRALRAEGWRVMRIWEHELKVSGRRRLHTKLQKALNKGQSSGTTRA